MLKYLIAAGFGLVSLMPSLSLAAEPESCKKVRFSDVGWTDITSTTSISSIILEALGYEPSSTMLSIPVTYASLKSKEIDVYLGDWEPAMVQDRKPYIEISP